MAKKTITKEVNVTESNYQGKRTKEREEYATTFWKRFEAYLKQRGDKLSTLARHMGLSPNYFISASGHNSVIGIDIFVKIIKSYPELSPDWLLTGEGMQFRGLSIEGNNQNNKLLENIELKRKDMLETVNEMRGLCTRMENLQSTYTTGKPPKKVKLR